MVCICLHLRLYCPHMSEPQEDLNAFSAEDSAGAVLTLGIVPVVACYIFFKEMTWLLVLFGAIAVGLTLFVYLLGKLTGWRAIGSMVNLLGCILVPAYVVGAICLWTSPHAPTARYYAAKKTGEQAEQPAGAEAAATEKSAEVTPAAAAN